MTRKFSGEDLKREITEEFIPLREKAKEIEEFFEENLNELTNNISRGDLLYLKENVKELRSLFSELKDLVFEVAGLVGDTKQGREALDVFDNINEKLRDLENIIEELLGLAKPMASGETIQSIKSELLKKYNGLVKHLRTFFTEELYDLLDKLQEEVEKEEIYYG